MMALLIVTRPEAPAWIIALSAATTLAIRQRSGAWRPALRAALPGLAGGLIALLLLTAFRLAYFGYPLPNTYYAKVSPDRWYNIRRGLHYGGAFLASGGVVAVGALAAIGHLARLLVPRARKAQPGDADALVTVASVMVITGIVIPVLVGGDHFGAFRFYQPIWPWLIVPLLPLLQPLFQRVTAFRRQDRPDFPWLIGYAANKYLADLRSDSRYTVHTLAYAPADNASPQHLPTP